MHLWFFMKEGFTCLWGLNFPIPWLSIDTDIRNPVQTQVELDDMHADAGRVCMDNTFILIESNIFLEASITDI